MPVDLHPDRYSGRPGLHSVVTARRTSQPGGAPGGRDRGNEACQDGQHGDDQQLLDRKREVGDSLVVHRGDDRPAVVSTPSTRPSTVPNSAMTRVGAGSPRR